MEYECDSEEAYRGGEGGEEEDEQGRGEAGRRRGMASVRRRLTSLVYTFVVDPAYLAGATNADALAASLSRSIATIMARLGANVTAVTPLTMHQLVNVTRNVTLHSSAKCPKGSWVRACV